MSKELSAVIAGKQTLRREYLHYTGYPQIQLIAHCSLLIASR